jgi:hypothetical protein
VNGTVLVLQLVPVPVMMIRSSVLPFCVIVNPQ